MIFLIYFLASRMSIELILDDNLKEIQFLDHISTLYIWAQDFLSPLGNGVF